MLCVYSSRTVWRIFFQLRVIFIMHSKFRDSLTRLLNSIEFNLPSNLIMLRVCSILLCSLVFEFYYFTLSMVHSLWRIFKRDLSRTVCSNFSRSTLLIIIIFDKLYFQRFTLFYREFAILHFDHTSRTILTDSVDTKHSYNLSQRMFWTFRHP